MTYYCFKLLVELHDKLSRWLWLHCRRRAQSAGTSSGAGWMWDARCGQLSNSLQRIQLQIIQTYFAEIIYAIRANVARCGQLSYSQFSYFKPAKVSLKIYCWNCCVLSEPKLLHFPSLLLVDFLPGESCGSVQRQSVSALIGWPALLCLALLCLVPFESWKLTSSALFSCLLKGLIGWPALLCLVLLF